METSYEDFEPLCKWRRDEKSDTLEVYLPGFERQQLKVVLGSSGIITISGERPLDEAKALRSRFSKEVPVSKDCQPNQIKARFSNGILSLVMPKQVSTISDAGRNVHTGRFLRSIMKMNKRVALEILVAISLLLAVGAYVKKYCQCSHIGN